MVEPHPRVAQGADHFESGCEPGDAVEAAARWHGIAVRTDRDDSNTRLLAGEPSDQIARGINTRRKPGRRERVGEAGAAFEKQRR